MNRWLKLAARGSMRLVVILGAILVAGGTLQAILVVSHSRTSNGLISGMVFWVAAGVASVIWVGMNLWANRSPLANGWSGRLFLHRAAGATTIFLAGMAIVGPNVPSSEYYYIRAMKDGLRELVEVQDSLFAEAGFYPSELPRELLSIRPGVRYPEIQGAEDGWTAVISHRGTARTCKVYVGRTGVVGTQEERRVLCHRMPLRIASLLWGLGTVALGGVLGVLGSVVLTTES